MTAALQVGPAIGLPLSGRLPMAGALHSSQALAADSAIASPVWTRRHAGWAAVAALLFGLVLGWAGFGGSGYGIVGDEEFSIRYPLILRRAAEGTLEITMTAPPADIELHFDRTFRDAFSVRSVTPPPGESFLTSWGTGYRFARTGEGPQMIRLVMSAGDVGWTGYSILVNGRMALISTFITP